MLDKVNIALHVDYKWIGEKSNVVVISLSVYKLPESLDIGGPLVHRARLSTESGCLIGVASYFLTARDHSKVTSVFTSVWDYPLFIQQAINRLSSPPRCQLLK